MQHFHLGATSKDLEFIKRFRKETVWFAPTFQGQLVFPTGFHPQAVPGLAATHMRSEDCVLGITVNGQSRAYPYWIADKHHSINDTVGGERVLITC